MAELGALAGAVTGHRHIGERPEVCGDTKQHRRFGEGGLTERFQNKVRDNAAAALSVYLCLEWFFTYPTAHKPTRKQPCR